MTSNNDGVHQEDIWAKELFTNVLCYAVILIPAAIVIKYVQRKYGHHPDSAPYLLRVFALDHTNTNKHYSIVDLGHDKAGDGRSDTDDPNLEETLPNLNDHSLVSALPHRVEHPDSCNSSNDSLAEPLISSASFPSPPLPNNEPDHDKTYYGLLLFCFAGLQIVFLTWGVVQEKIITKPYRRITNPNNSRSEDIFDNFTDSQFLVFTNKLSGFFLAGLWLLTRSYFFTSIWSFSTRTKPSQSSKHSTTYYHHHTHTHSRRHSLGQNDENNKLVKPALYRYSYASLSNILSSWCQYEALKFVSFPTQVLFKSGKIIPVMIMSKFLSTSNQKKNYPFHEYFCAGLVSLGIGMFLISRRITTTGDDDRRHSYRLDKSSLMTLYPSEPPLFLVSEQFRTPLPPPSSEAGGSWNIAFKYASFTTISGIILLVGYVIFDSFTSNWQAQIFERYNGKRSTTHVTVTSVVSDNAPKIYRGKDDDYYSSSHDSGKCNELNNVVVNVPSKHNYKSRPSPSQHNNGGSNRNENDKNVTSWDMMCFVNLFSSIFTGLSLVLRDFHHASTTYSSPTTAVGMPQSPGSNNGLMESFAFAKNHDISFLVDMFTLSLCSALGQIFIFLTISKFGAVTFVTAMTVRQGFAVLLSCLIYGHKINAMGFSGILIVFLALFAKIYLNGRRSRGTKKDVHVQSKFLLGGNISDKCNNVNSPNTTTTTAFKYIIYRWLLPLKYFVRGNRLKKRFRVFGV